MGHHSAELGRRRDGGVHCGGPGQGTDLVPREGCRGRLGTWEVELNLSYFSAVTGFALAVLNAIGSA